jgi:hypothetical protein
LPSPSDDGGRDELEESLPRRRSSSATRAASAALAAASLALAWCSWSITIAWTATVASRSRSGKRSRPPGHQRSRPLAQSRGCQGNRGPQGDPAGPAGPPACGPPGTVTPSRLARSTRPWIVGRVAQHGARGSVTAGWCECDSSGQARAAWSPPGLDGRAGIRTQNHQLVSDPMVEPQEATVQTPRHPCGEDGDRARSQRESRARTCRLRQLRLMPRASVG